MNKFKQYLPHESEPSTHRSSLSLQIQRFLSFADEKEEECKHKLKRRNMEGPSTGSAEIQLSNGIQNNNPSIFVERRDADACFH